ncbi:DUF1996 domain-containing protein [Micromonospora deserti]|uniref:DUF1996 domain-containing protein n=1 Tax=Micromonospora deserti TaxID=2070366 RepID=A0A2W2E9I8_9ACTN|nr:DUF1996 domain-containing protein [Micromonospora deserti]PZG01564.1 hypothetical protein C1I99_06675 [Micromonospora deserti]
MSHGVRRTRTRWQEFRIVAVAFTLSAVGAVTAGVVVSSRNGRALAEAAPVSSFVPIEQVTPNVKAPPPRRSGSAGVFTVDCGTNENGKFSPDNPVAQPGVRNGAQHVHDFVGNLSITADSTDESLAASGTTCRNGDRSSYFWPVVRIDRQANRQTNPVGADADTLRAAGPGTVGCPTVRDKLPAVPARAADEVNRNLALLDRQMAEANRRLVTSRGEGGPNFVNNAILGPLRDKRIATLDRIAIAIGRQSARPTGLVSLADCEVSYDGAHAGHHGGAATGGAPSGNVVTPTVNCPTVRDKLRAVPARAADEVNRNLALLDRQIAEANQRLVTTQGEGGPNFVNNAILGPLRDKRIATLDRIAIAIGRQGARPTGLAALAWCSLNGAGSGPAPSASASAGGELPGVQGPNLEIAGNVGAILRPTRVQIEYRGNPTTKVVAMPRFLRALTGESKPTSRGPANARASWTCSGFTDRLTDRYPICPPGSQVMRVHDFPSCWDGENIDSANHRDHIRFPDAATGACPAGTVAVPQLRIGISYNIPLDVQRNGQYQLDSFPEENHNPASDHNDFINVNSTRQMAKIVNCVNAGRRCG